MFLKNLFNYNKVLFSAFVLFIVLFVFINLKKGMVVSPVYQFGMYSGQQNLSDTISSFRIVADGKEIDLSKLSFIQVDELMNPLCAFFDAREDNKEVAKTLNSFFSKIGLNFPNKILPGSETDKERFSSWYKELLSSLIGLKVQQLNIYRQRFTWNYGLQAISSPARIL